MCGREVQVGDLVRDRWGSQYTLVQLYLPGMPGWVKVQCTVANITSVQVRRMSDFGADFELGELLHPDPWAEEVQA